MVGASAEGCSSASTTGWPDVSTTRPPANASCSATHAAARRMSPRRAGSPLMLEIATNSASVRSEDGMAAIDRKHLSGYPRRLLGCEEEDTARDVCRGAKAPGRDRIEQALLPLLAIALELRDRGGVREHEAGCDRVDGDAEPA